MPVETLIARCIDRDPAAWKEMMDLHRPMVLRVLVRSLGTIDPGVVTDLEQDLWARLLLNDCEVLRGLQGKLENGLAPFLATAALNLARDQKRRLGVRRIVQSGGLDELASEMEAPGDRQDVAYEKEERRRLLWQAVDEQATGANAERDRMIFKAHYMDGLSPSEVAAMGVGLSAKGVETVLYRMLQRVRQALRAGSENAA